MVQTKNYFSFFLLTLASIYTVGYLLWRGLLLTPLYDASWHLQLSEVFGAWFYLPLLPLLLLGLIVRNRHAVAIVAIPFAFFAWEYGAQFLPNWQHGFSTPAAWAQEDADQHLRVATWNTLYSSAVQDDFDALLQTERPDIVTLQEASYGMRHLLEQEYSELYPYQYSRHYGRLVTLSRYPMTPLLTDSLLLRGCRCQPLRVEWRDRSLTLINIHLPSPDVRFNLRNRVPRITRFDRRNQEPYYIVLFKILDQFDGPIIMQGDINTTERQPNFKRLTSTFTDSFAEAGWGFGFTFPNLAPRGPKWAVPLVQIDHILHTDEFVAVAARTERLQQSDHLAVLATLRWRE